MTPERRVSPWWMLLPAILFVANFIGGLTQDTGDRANAVYDLPTLVGSGAIEVAFAAYAVLAVRISRSRSPRRSRSGECRFVQPS